MMHKKCCRVVLGLLFVLLGVNLSLAGDGREHLQPVFHLLLSGTVHVAVADSIFSPGEAISVRLMNMPGNDEDWVGIYPKGITSDWGNEVGWAWANSRGAQTVTVNVGNLEPGIYEARVFFNNTFTVEATCSFLVYDSTVLSRPVFSDPGGVSELTGDWHGAMGEHPVRKITIANPAYPNGIHDNDGNDYNLHVDLYLPADMPGKRPTVFFIAGWHVYKSETYRSLLYFIASQGFNCVYIPYRHPDPTNDPTLLLSILDSVVDQFSPIVDTSKFGYMGHSEGAGLAFYLAKDRPRWGTNGRFIFSMAAWWGFNLPATGNVEYPPNTNMIVQVNHYDSGTDPRQNIDFLLHNNIPAERKTYLYLPGDANHVSNHGVSYSGFENGHYTYDALEQVGLYRPLESLMRYSFEGDTQWKKIGLPDPGNANYDTLYTLNGITVLSTDDPLGNDDVPIPKEADLDGDYLCSQHIQGSYYNPRWRMCMPCGDTGRDVSWQQCDN